jgi:uncharacterized protein YqeY
MMTDEAPPQASPAVVPSSIKAQLAVDMKDAMKTKQKEKLAAIRSIQAAIKQVEVDQRVLVDDEAAIAIMTKLVKQRKESIKSYSDAGRKDLADTEELELSYFAAYMPSPMSEAELLLLIEKTITEVGATTIKDMGKVMAQLRPIVAGKCDPAAVGQLIKQKLSGK